MRILKYQLKFNTPAFLGDAEQNGRWRTPPIKALLRQWWRMAWAADHDYPKDTASMRQKEGVLFGVASDGKGDSSKSRIRIRLDKWDEGSLKKDQWPADMTVYHPEVKRQGRPVPVGSALYQGFGPLKNDDKRHTTTLKANAAIQAGETATLSIAFPAENARHIERALWLMDRYGTLGGRSRNGWGSFALLPQPSGEGWGEGDSGVRQVPLRDWQECLNLDWPHAIGKDQKGALIWQTAPHNDWMALMKTMAVIKIGLRTQFTFPNAAPPHADPLPRHWISYPITRHTTKAFDRNARLPNTLRFKASQTSEDKLVGVIFHVPHLPPAAFNPKKKEIINTWQSVHSLLDEMCKPTNARSYVSIQNAQRRNDLKPQLHSVSLKRIPE